jgi:hypothetical protein
MPHGFRSHPSRFNCLKISAFFALNVSERYNSFFPLAVIFSRTRDRPRQKLPVVIIPD